MDNPYFQNATKNQAGCQIDYLIQTEYGILYLIEVKFSKRVVKPTVIKEVKEKMAKLTLSEGLSVRPVLIHVNGVSDHVKKSNYFTHIINFSNLLSI